MTRVQSCRWVVAAGFVTLVAAHNGALVHRRPAAELIIRMQAGIPSQAKVYFDTGGGFNEVDRVLERVRATPDAQQLVFPLPIATIRSLRFEALETAGKVQITEILIRRPRTQVLLHRFIPSKIAPGSETSLILRDSTLEVASVAPERGPQLVLACDPPLTIRYSAQQVFSTRFFRINAIWLAVGILLFLADRFRNQWWPRGARPVLAIDRTFVAWSDRLTVSAVLPLDRVALWYYAACFVVFATLAVAGLHGSSIRMYGWMYKYSPVQQLPLLGKPKDIRCDEWNYHTPAILNQYSRRDRFAADSSQFGPDKAALFSNVPTRHWTEWFRPQFWVFHCLPPAAAYACYWQTKGLLLLTGTFSLLLLLTRSSIAAMLGALWYFFSAYTQWCYSWPTLLPEMIGLFGWVICFAAYLTVARHRWRLLLVAFLCTLFAVDFALCAYPPHQFPLVLFGLGIATWWLWTHAHLIISNEARRARTLAAGGCCLGIALIMTLFYLDVRIGFGELARTIYPGQRSAAGGSVTVAQMLSHFLDYWKNETHFPAPLLNICEASGFLWLAPLTLLMPRLPATPRRTRLASLLLWLTFLLLAAWMLLPIPATVGKIFLFDEVVPYRCLPTLGLINTAIVVMAVASMELREARLMRILWRKESAVCLGLLILVLVALAYMNSVYHRFFTLFALSVAAAYVTFIFFCLRNGWRGPLAGALLLPAIATTALINPVDRGLDVVFKSPLSIMIQQQPELRNGRWLVFSSWVTLPGFYSACGLDLINGLKIIPARDELARFDPTGKYGSVINQSGYLVARVRTDGGPSEFESPNIGLVIWKVNPLDPRLKEIGVKYFAFESPPEASILQKLKPLLTEEANHIWAYELL